ncbi:MAG: hypothetical protein JWR80_7965 [Bradyrhizobium sp.]|nr:hypothetical protein [Bradyrhizobium sp.]
MTFVKGHKAANRKLPPDDVLRAHIAAGLTATDIARIYDVAADNVRCTLRKLALIPPATSQRNKKLPSGTVLRAHIAAGLRNIDIAKTYGVAEYSVSRALRRSDIAMPAAETSAPIRRHPDDTAHKVVRNGISRARVPSIDGYFQGVV